MAFVMNFALPLTSALVDVVALSVQGWQRKVQDLVGCCHPLQLDVDSQCTTDMGKVSGTFEWPGLQNI